MVYRTPAFSLDTSDLSVRRPDGTPVKLYNKDYELLAYLCARAGEAVDASEIVEAVWDRNADYSSNVVASSVSNVRKALGKDAILTVRNRYMVASMNTGAYRSTRTGYWMLGIAALAVASLVGFPLIFPVKSVVISSIDGINPPGNDNERLDGEYVILKNSGNETVDLSDWTVSDETGHSYRFGSRVLAPWAEVRLVTGKCPDDAATACWGFGWGYAVWNNDKDAAFVRDPDGRTMTVRRWDYRE